MKYDAYYKARDSIFELIYRDAFGPIQPDETLSEPPLDNYVCGILWPKGTSITPNSASEEKALKEPSEQMPDMNTGFELEDEPGNVIREANQFRPSVMAVSFALPADAETIDVQFTAGKYENIEVPVEGKAYIYHHYHRVPLDTDVINIKLPNRAWKRRLFDGICQMQLIRRRAVSGNAALWTLSVENLNDADRNDIAQNTSSIFQCRLTIRARFCPMDNNAMTSGDEDRQKQDFLYRHSRCYAVGHGCSAEWDAEAGAIDEIRSTFLPRASVSQMIAATDDGFTCFKMSSWQTEWREEGLTQLNRYIDKYISWADGLAREQDEIPKVFREVAQDILDRIGDCATRLRAGVDTLRNNDLAWRAFCLMNLAMARQSAKKRNQPVEEVSWYPFQLCYVLMCVPDMTDPASKWRDVVDLLWFPTGGGKTEAYLGVAAYTIFFRRLSRGEAGKGVTVLMRYTLRMLTAQQFERAAALICECELIRRHERLPGGEISIGLWVGGEVTPNHVSLPQGDAETAETVLEKLKSGWVDDVRTTPVQLVACPHCGTPLLPQNAYAIHKGQFRTHCPNPECPFHADLPVITVDDDVYARRPTLLIGTIDKFARLTWEDKTGAIFAEDGVGMPPELLIQDELHLISGPLGSISGLYEIVIERLCVQNGIRPKILASTATLCNAKAQIRALYGKSAFQFPPSGFDAEDSFFARTATPEERPQRLYVGYCETGGSLPDAVVRTFGVVRFALEYLIRTGTEERVIDQFWTNVGYFNSLKDLGSADTLILDRVCAYAESLRRHKFKALAERSGMQKISDQYEHDELTSRKSAREITDTRNLLDKIHYPNPAALSYVLSSNMLSVGIDINRLGLMTVYGQPKATAEYIQATSRVGRSNPGLVIVLLHMLRTRDKSHFEQFQTYHQALNKMVEPTSATPYACRTMDKALHSVFVALIRHQCPVLRENKAAAKFRQNDPDVQRIYRELLELIELRSDETARYARSILDDFIQQWHVEAMLKGSHFQYTLLNKSENDTDVLLIPAERSENAQFPPTMNSMRNVDTQSGVYLKTRR